MASLNGPTPVGLPHQAKSFCLKSVLFGVFLSEFCRILTMTNGICQRRCPAPLGEGLRGGGCQRQVLARSGQIVIWASWVCWPADGVWLSVSASAD